MLNDIALNRLKIKETSDHPSTAPTTHRVVASRYQTPLPNSSFQFDGDARAILVKIQRKVNYLSNRSNE